MIAERIVEYPYPTLRQKARPVRKITDATRDLVAKMTGLLRERGGLGLAANQVGSLERVIILQRGEQMVPYVNPIIVRSSEQEISDEGCLSLPSLYAMVSRHAGVTVRARTLAGREVKVEAEGLEARAFQHEIDHLDGVLFPDRAEPDSFFWLVEGENGELVRQPTSLEDALKVFELRNLAGV